MELVQTQNRLFAFYECRAADAEIFKIVRNLICTFLNFLRTVQKTSVCSDGSNY